VVLPVVAYAGSLAILTAIWTAVHYWQANEAGGSLILPDTS
jgi:hypothetical protein